MIGLGLSAILLLGTPSSGDDLLEIARLSLEGPLREVTLDMGAAGETLIHLDLAAGESRRLEVPVPPRSLDERPPRIRSAPPQGRVTFQDWVDPGERQGEWDALPAALRNRTRAPVEAGRVLASPQALALVLAAGVLVLGLRRRVSAVALASLAGCWLVIQAVRDSPGDSSRVESVLEGEAWGLPGARVAEWVLSETGSDSLLVDLARCLRLEGDRPGRLVWTVTVGTARRDVRNQVRLEGGLITSLSRMDPGTRQFSPVLNDWDALKEVWTREPDGAWLAHGPWLKGEELPAPLDPGAEAGLPPGWLCAGLPMGTRVLVGRLGGGVAWTSCVTLGYTVVPEVVLPGPGLTGPQWLRLVDRL